MNEISEQTLRLVMHGRVQGVWYRDSMRRKAQALGVKGWVRNRKNGTVEAMLQGEVAAVESVIAWARRGPEQAQVTKVDIASGSGEFSDFEVRGK